MAYLALLRGINVGGKAKVSMAALKTSFETLGFTNIKTFINSGNILFSTDKTERKELTKIIESTLAKDFGMPIKVLLKTSSELKILAAAIPDTWVNNEGNKCDVFFLWPEIDNPEILQMLPNNPSIEDIRYEPGAVFWHIDRKLAGKTHMTRIVGTTLYHQITIRNTNTVRKLAALAENYD